MKTTVSLVIIASLVGLVLAATQTIDGLAISAADWGLAPVAVQDTNTRFGDNANELNLLFVDSDDSNVYMGIPGNIADNNALMIFIDVDAAAGSETLSTEPNEACPGTVPTLTRIFNRSVMDAGFTPDFALIISVGIFPGQSTSQLVFAADLTDLNTLANQSLGVGAIGTGNGLLTGDSGVQIAIDNSNFRGVENWDPNFPIADPNLPFTANTGYEIAIPRALLGLDTAIDANVSIMTYISNNGQDAGDGVCFGRSGFGSNQALPGLQGADNLGLFSGVSLWLDFSAIVGDQFVTVVVPGLP